MKTTDTPKTDIDAREIEIQRNELLACMEFLRDVITHEATEEAIEDVGWNHENGTPIQWVDWCLRRVRENSLENAIAKASAACAPNNNQGASPPSTSATCCALLDSP